MRPKYSNNGAEEGEVKEEVDRPETFLGSVPSSPSLLKGRARRGLSGREESPSDNGVSPEPEVEFY